MKRNVPFQAVIYSNVVKKKDRNKVVHQFSLTHNTKYPVDSSGDCGELFHTWEMWLSPYSENQWGARLVGRTHIHG